MKRMLKVSALLAGAVALALATAAPAAADGGKHGKRGWDRDYRGGGYSRDYGRDHRGRGYGHDYRGGPRDGRYWGKPRHRHRYRHRHYGHRHRHNDLGAAFALGALIAVPFILSTRQYEERTVTVRPAPDYTPPPQPYPQSQPQYQSQAADAGGVCLQEREYQTTVIVGGEEVPAYGTACLQPDGAWRRGPATAVPD